MTTIDFNRAIQDAKGASFEALPIGDYDVEVTKTEAVTSSNGKPMIKTTFKVVAGPYERRPIINQFVFSGENPQAVAIFFRHMKAFGLTEEWFASLGQVGSLEPVATALVGRRARLSLGHREWQGETRNEVKGVKPYTGAPPVAGPAGPTAGPAPVGLGPLPPTATGAPAPVVAPPVVPPVPAPIVVPPVPVVQPMPQPPAPAPVAAIPTSEPPVATFTGGDAGAPATPPSPVATSEVAPATAPPALPF